MSDKYNSWENGLLQLLFHNAGWDARSPDRAILTAMEAAGVTIDAVSASFHLGGWDAVLALMEEHNVIDPSMPLALRDSSTAGELYVALHTDPAAPAEVSYTQYARVKTK